MSYSAGDILLVSILFSDGSGRKLRPVVLIYDSGDADLLVAPVTSQSARSPRDVAVVNWQAAGLRLASSIVRIDKLATVEKSTVTKKLGRLAPADWNAMKAVLKQFFTEIVSK